MPAKTTSEAPVSRRSARLAGHSIATNGESAETKSKVKEAKETDGHSKKRAAESSAKDDNAKKTKTKATPSTAKANGTNGKGVSTSKSAAQKEKEAEAPASAKAETTARGQLKEGDKLPKITLKDHTGKDVDVSTLAGEKGIVIFLYPKADTPGCTTQACGFRDKYDEITDFGYDIFGLSKDKPEAQQKWVTKKNLNYKLLCDPESKLIRRLGAFVPPNNTKRSHFIFEKGTGKLIDIALGVKPVNDPENVLKFLGKHHG